MIISLGADQKSPALVGRRQVSPPITSSDVFACGRGMVLFKTFSSKNLDEL